MMARRTKRWMAFLATSTLLLALLIAGQGLADPALTSMEELGEHLYFDENLSGPKGQSCASCHDPDFGFVDPDSQLPVSEGVLPHRVGNRNSPSSAYAMYAPAFDEEEGIGGQFWDGRATGEVLGDPLADQALGPFLNPVEMANPNKQTVINGIKQSDYADLFEEVWYEGILKDTEAAYDAVALSIAAFERTAEFAPFDSKYDHYLQACLVAGGDKDDCAKGMGPIAEDVGEDVFTPQEWAGLQLFMNENNNNDGLLDPNEGAACVLCHVADWVDPGTLANPVIVPDWPGSDGMIPPMFTDFTYDNLGVPKNWDSPFLYLPPNLNPDGEDFVDIGLGAFVDGEDGLFKVMTLRNIGLTAPYAHNGFFDTLQEITDFYNTRDVPGMWPAPEVEANVNFDELGNLGLSLEQVEALVAFMNTLSDGWLP